MHYKLVGTRSRNISQCDFSNRYLDKLNYSGRDDVDWEIDATGMLHATRNPIVRRMQPAGRGARASSPPTNTPSCHCGATTIPAGSFVAIEVYDGIDSHRIPDWTKVTLKDEAAR